MKDDPAQTDAARSLLERAELVAIPVAVFCEFAWVLARGYRYTKPQIGIAITKYLRAARVVTDMAAVEAGLALNDLGGDFSDGAIACQGRAMGGTLFASFDREAVGLLEKQGLKTVLF